MIPQQWTGTVDPHDARLEKYGSTLDRWNVRHVIERIADYPEIVTAALATLNLRERLAEAYDEGYDSCASDGAPQFHNGNPYRDDSDAQEKPRRRVIGSDGASRPERGQP